MSAAPALVFAAPAGRSPRPMYRALTARQSVLRQVHLAMTYADRIVALRDGRVLQDARVGQFDPRAIEQIYGRNGEPA